MVARFSERYNLVPSKEIQLDDIDNSLFCRLWNIIYEREYCTIYDDDGLGNVEKILDFLGCTYEFPEQRYIKNVNLKKLHDILIEGEWHLIYDVMEKYISLAGYSGDRKNLEASFNTVLEDEKSGYRIIKGLVTAITDEESLVALRKATSTIFSSVNKHMEKALALYSDRKNPDYENSIKESISAVEAICCVITGLKGGEATLGKMLKKLEDNGIEIHGSMKAAFAQLYGFTSDENGIRHGGIDFRNASSEDAYFMLISCSAFINYLKVKYGKIK